jgi:membrane-associated phospholipid phosphatase
MLCYLSVAALTAQRPTHQLLLPGEARIPFAPEWGSVYVLAYVFPLVPIFTVRDGDRFARLMIAVGLTMLVAYSCFLAYPVVVPRPPLEVHSVGSYLLAVQYRWDEPRNAFPSLHVAFCWLFWLASRERAAWSVPLLAVVAAISVSTVLVRQHNVMDVLGGLVLAQAAWAAAGSLARRPATATGDSA